MRETSMTDFQGKRASAPTKGNNPYSPVMCISLLLIVGLIVKFGSIVQMHLVQN